MPNKEVSVPVAAAKLAVGVGHLYTLLRSGRVRARKRDGLWMVSWDSVLKRVAARRRREETLKRAASEIAALKNADQAEVTNDVPHRLTA